ncbi:HD domain-containing protein [Rhodocyclus tenuis]|uniref:HD-CE domain-containing protein n=1 Tax=Rhodocyclus tenuis TaxID=1066 RepID=A0A840GBM8_RHOTE|nr:ATP-binding protein [Rhodocyclus tenuis]MBB4246012.1 hypothetical protein [Rhodocyclus tenuis]
MTRTICVTRVEETNLWKELSNRDSETAKHLATNVVAVCAEAADRMKAMAGYAPQYTLHDERHLLRTTELMSLVLGDEAKKLNEIELALLILSAFFHDQGMLPSDSDLLKLRDSEEFKLFQDNWRVDHPNFAETSRQLADSTVAIGRRELLGAQIAELDTAMLTDFLRQGHGKRSSEYVLSRYKDDKRIEAQGTNLSPLIGLLCEAHTLPADDLIPTRGFRYDEQVGTYRINMPFLAAVLRLADILDFDRERTPEVLFKSIHFTSPVSLFEWEKHRAVDGWVISKELIRFSVKCEHPAYQAAALTYMGWIDQELEAAHSICRLQPRDIDGYQLRLPTHVDRSRIEPDGDSYRYHNLEFSLSRDEIIRLLMTDKLYGGEHLCIRELLQNSLDALRYRQALFADSGIQWSKGEVEFRHFVDNDGYEVVECRDNGTGMDEGIIRRFLVKVGRSFYRSPEFERERTRWRATGSDFDPCSRFGIGFMSCFMLGDRITIETRKDYGHGREWGDPLVVEIQGLSGLIVVRKGSNQQSIGTTVRIVARKKPSLVDEWTDKVKLTTVLRGYALATEFPILGKCEVKEIEDIVTIPVMIEKTPTILELANIKAAQTFEQDVSEVSKNLRGFIRNSVLLDDAGLPCLNNREAEWIADAAGPGKNWALRVRPETTPFPLNKHSDIQVCVDGILVGGEPGRHSDADTIRHRLGWRNSGIYCMSPALIDTRGDLKPEITPGRTPPDQNLSQQLPGWRRINSSFNIGNGMLWKQLTNYLSKGLLPQTFWQLSVIYSIPIDWIPSSALWETLSVSLVDNDEQIEWRKVRELGELLMCADENDSFALRNKQGASVGPDLSLKDWEAKGEELPSLSWQMRSSVLLMSALDIRDGQVVFDPTAQPDRGIPLGMYKRSVAFSVSGFFLNYVGAATNAVAVETPFPTANRNHPLVALAHQSKNVNEPTDLQRFAQGFVACISESVSSRKGTPTLDNVSYWQKRVGHLYSAVQWDQCEQNLKPPYHLWTRANGWFSFGELDFTRWKDAEL